MSFSIRLRCKIDEYLKKNTAEMKRERERAKINTKYVTIIWKWGKSENLYKRNSNDYSVCFFSVFFSVCFVSFASHFSYFLCSSSLENVYNSLLTFVVSALNQSYFYKRQHGKNGREDRTKKSPSNKKKKVNGYTVHFCCHVLKIDVNDKLLWKAVYLPYLEM